MQALSGRAAEDERTTPGMASTVPAMLGLVWLAVLGSLLFFGAGAGATEGAPPAPGGCPAVAPLPQPPSPGKASTTGTHETTVVVVVPAVTIVLLNGAGAPIAVETNTGHAPSCSSLFFVTSHPDDHDLRRANLQQENQVMRMDLSSVTRWQPEWHPV